MPRIIGKLLAGRTVEQKHRLGVAITEAVIAEAGVGAGTASVAIEDVRRDDWADQVYRPDILAKSATIIKPPGYRLR